MSRKIVSKQFFFDENRLSRVSDLTSFYVLSFNNSILKFLVRSIKTLLNFSAYSRYIISARYIRPKLAASLFKSSYKRCTQLKRLQII